MSKIICDVCGTAYPETASQCPICGSAKPDDMQPVVAETEEAGAPHSSSYTHVKGGRFSKSNVRKRNKENQATDTHTDREVKKEAVSAVQADEKEKKSNGGLWATVIILLLAIAAVSAYIAVRFFSPNWLAWFQEDTKPQVTQTEPADTASAAPTGTTAEPTFPCTDLLLSETVIELQELNAAHLVNVTAVPENTTDKITYTSSDPEIVTINSEGRVNAVAPGQAYITITCGNITREVQVICNFVVAPQTEPTEASAEPTDAATEPTSSPTQGIEINLVLNKSDFSLFFRGDSWKVYDGEYADLITWTSDNENVAKIENGVVTATGKGVTEIHGEYNGQKVSCIVRCTFG